VQLSQLLGCVAAQSLHLDVSVLAHELVYAHKATAHAHHESVVHDLGIDSPRAKHVQLVADPGNRYFDLVVADVSGQHLVDQVTFQCAPVPRLGQIQVLGLSQVPFFDLFEDLFLPLQLEVQLSARLMAIFNIFTYSVDLLGQPVNFIPLLPGYFPLCSKTQIEGFYAGYNFPRFQVKCRKLLIAKPELLQTLRVAMLQACVFAL
jgi:hypothetical protein